MILNQETLRLIFGLKLRQFRTQKKLSLKELAQSTGLSPSYINEIEKGKKYPKNDKIMLLANSLQVNYDELISLRLGHDLALLTTILETNLLRNLPFKLFGIPSSALFELISANPKKFPIFIGTLIELARNIDLKVEDFLFASLKSYLEQQNNYFERLEERSVEFSYRFTGLHQKGLTIPVLSGILGDYYHYQIVETELPHPELKYALISRRNETILLLNQHLCTREKLFILAREIGHNYLGLVERPSSSTSSNIDSFEQLYNRFQSSYFVSALFLPQESFIQQVKLLWQQQHWQSTTFLQLLESCKGPFETFFHRLSQILPHYFGIKNIFLVRAQYNRPTHTLSLNTILNFTPFNTPRDQQVLGHHCRKWGAIKSLLQPRSLPIWAERITTIQDQHSYLCITSTRVEQHAPHLTTSITLGILINDDIKEQINFWNDVSLEAVTISSSCLRCSISHCEERTTAPLILQQQQKEKELSESLEHLTQTWPS